MRETAVVVAGTRIPPGLRRVSQPELGHFEDALRSLETVGLGHLGTEVESHIDGNVAVLEQARVNVRHVATIFPAQNPSHGHCALGRLIPTQDEHHSAHQVYQEIASHAGTVFLPAPPACKDFWTERPLRHRALPRVPVAVLWRTIEGRGLLPG